MVTPFWPRRSPHFLACRRGVREAVYGADASRSVVVGLSGGPDSLALLAAAVAEGLEVEAVCVDHQLQDGSRAVAERAAAQARSLGATARVVAVHVTGTEGMEDSARRARYQALARAANGREVLVAHTAEDQAETLLLGLLRGQVAGMAPRAVIEGARVVRPLLSVRRADTVGACTELNMEYWDDPHNADTAFRRVALRRDIIPRLSALAGGDAVAPLAQAAGDAARDDAELARLAGAETAGARAELDCAELAAAPEPLRRRTIAAWLVAHGVAVTRAGLRDIGKLCTDWHGQGGVGVKPHPAGPRGARLEVRRVGGRLSLLST